MFSPNETSQDDLVEMLIDALQTPTHASPYVSRANMSNASRSTEQWARGQLIPSPRMEGTQTMDTSDIGLVRNVKSARLNSQAPEISAGFSMPAPNLEVESSMFNLNIPAVGAQENESGRPYSRFRPRRRKPQPAPVKHQKPMSSLETKLLMSMMDDKMKAAQNAESSVPSVTPVYPVSMLSQSDAAPTNLRPKPIITSLDTEKYIQPTPMLSPRNVARLTKARDNETMFNAEKDMMVGFPVQLYYITFSPSCSQNIAYLGPNNIIINESCTNIFFRNARLTLDGWPGFLSNMRTYGWYRLEAPHFTHHEGNLIIWRQFVLTDGLFIPNMSESDIMQDGPKRRENRILTLSPSSRQEKQSRLS